MLKIAIIGAGFIGKIHAESFNSIKGAKITSIVDISEKAGKELAKELKADYFSDIDNLLARSAIDGFIVAVPQFLHYEVVKKIVGYGKPILCEKPLALNLEEADKMIDLVERKNIIAMTGHVIRFFPEYIRAREIVKSGSLGEPLFCYAERLSSPPDWAEWRFDEKSSGGAALDLHIHDLDFLIWLFGKPDSIRSQAVFNQDHGGIVHISSMVKFDGNRSGLAQGGWDFPGSFPFTAGFKILCKDGVIEWGFKAGKNIEQRDNKSNFLVYRSDGKVLKQEVDETDSFVLEDRYFIDCIKNNKKPEIATFRDGRDILELALASIRSAKDAKTFHFN